MGMRAVVDDPDLLDLAGTSPRRVRRSAWIIGAAFGALAGILLAPSVNAEPLLLTMLVVQAFGAAAVGYFSSMPLTYAGGLGIGVVAALTTKYVSTAAWLGGLAPSVPFIVLFVALLVTPRDKLAVRRFTRTVVGAHSAWTAPPRVRAIAIAAALIPLALVPSLVGTKLAIWSSGLTEVILFLSLGLLVKTSGQVSLCQVGFAAVGATTFAHFAGDVGLPWFVALLGAGLVTAAVGAFVAIPAIRLSGVFLALATLGFGIVLEQLFYGTSLMFGSSLATFTAPRPSFARSDEAYYFVLLGFVAATVAVVSAVHSSRLGRLLRAMGESPLALDTSGANSNVTRVLVFCLSAFFAGLSGGLLSALNTFVNPVGYASFTSLIVLALVVIVPGREPWYALIGVALFSIIPAYVSVDNVGSWQGLLFGLSAVLVALSARRGGLVPAFVRERVDRFGARGQAKDALSSTAREAQPRFEKRPVAAGLTIEHVTVRYGGNLAVDNVDLEAPVGRITGLIGPNGAGKTSLFNAACGLVPLTSGRVVANGHDLAGRRTWSRAQTGLGRTFQRSELCGSLSVEDNVALGAEATLAGGNIYAHGVAHRGDKRRVDELSSEAIELCGLASLRQRPVHQLSTGQRRLVELARCLTGEFDVLLLDEPSSGLDASETRRFGEVLVRVVEDRGTGILLVEHDMALVMSICSYIYVLDFGALLFEGDPRSVESSPVVRAAYLGEVDTHSSNGSASGSSRLIMGS
jgi:ABC-type branched-subunit amino acid transport system ATPase component/ABC-type branched-subunit amino acid transport system permease subunit